MKGRKKDAGFTLVELLLVVVIIGILAALVIPRIAGRAEEARKEAARHDLATIVNALNTFEMHCSRFPSTQEGLAGLMAPPPGIEEGKWRGPYLEMQSVPVDPWGHEYVYRYEEGSGVFSLFSKGPDGNENTEDDIQRR